MKLVFQGNCVIIVLEKNVPISIQWNNSLEISGYSEKVRIIKWSHIKSSDSTASSEHRLVRGIKWWPMQKPKIRISAVLMGLCPKDVLFFFFQVYCLPNSSPRKGWKKGERKEKGKPKKTGLIKTIMLRRYQQLYCFSF